VPNLVLLSDILSRAQQLADMEGDDSISSTEWNGLVSESYGELYEDVSDAGLRYFEWLQTYTTDTSGYLAEPDDQLAIVDRLELVVNPTTGKCRRLKSILPQERARWSGRIGIPRAYELVDGRYFLYPTPPAGQTIILRYIRQCPDLTDYAGDEAIDTVSAYGRRFLQYGTAASAVQKSRRDASELIAEREQAREKLIEWAGNRAFRDQHPLFTEDGDDDGSDMPVDWDF
jgi:hypothetical protein